MFPRCKVIVYLSFPHHLYFWSLRMLYAQCGAGGTPWGREPIPWKVAPIQQSMTVAFPSNRGETAIAERPNWNVPLKTGMSVRFTKCWCPKIIPCESAASAVISSTATCLHNEARSKLSSFTNVLMNETVLFWFICHWSLFPKATYVIKNTLDQWMHTFLIIVTPVRIRTLAR